MLKEIGAHHIRVQHIHSTHCDTPHNFLAVGHCRECYLECPALDESKNIKNLASGEARNYGRETVANNFMNRHF